MKTGDNIYSDPETSKSLKRRYFLIIDGANVVYLEEGALAYYLDKSTGEWVENAFAWRHISGIGGDSDCEEICEKQARNWVSDNLPGLEVDWT